MTSLKSLNKHLFAINILIIVFGKILTLLNIYNKKRSELLYKVGFYKLQCKKNKHTWEVNNDGLTKDTFIIIQKIHLNYYKCKYCNHFKMESKCSESDLVILFKHMDFTFSDILRKVVLEKTLYERRAYRKSVLFEKTIRKAQKIFVDTHTGNIDLIYNHN